MPAYQSNPSVSASAHSPVALKDRDGISAGAEGMEEGGRGGWGCVGRV